MPHNSESHHLHQDYDDPESLGGVNEGIFTSHTDEDGTLPTTNSIEWFPDASQTYGKGHMFLDLFHSDENSIYHMKNLYYSFSGQKEWEVASWLLHFGLSMGNINIFLSLEMIKDLSLSFSSAKELILNHPTFDKELDFTPRRMCTTAQRLYCVYSKWMTGNDAWEMQCLDIVLEPLKQAACEGVMLSDPVSHSHYCFTPFASYIVDTLEAMMLATIGGKMSLVTMASYKQFGDPFLHEP
ncbi:hypothetical protein BD769DRAFT_1380649 [Suillus cothurnatus]|nr:hypothetical protein BD769DRAFT_1380649 [Suillus cothurnatus]